MTRVLRMLAVLVLLLAACGGGDEGDGDPTTVAPSADGATTTEAPGTVAPTTQAPAVTVGNDFCGFAVEYVNSADFSLVGFSPAEVEATLMSSLDALNQAVAIAPGEIQDDVQLFVDAYAGFVDFLGEYGWNFFAIPQDALDDPRLAALEDPALDAAGDNIGEFCGIDNFIATAPPDPGGGSGGGTVPGGEAPGDFPAALAPPGGEVVSSVSVGGADSVTFDVESSVADLIAFYTEVLGPPMQTLPDPAGALWITQFEGRSATVTVVEIGPDTSQANVTLA